jgi:Holliday junction resolvase RusA-like endonuclease
MTTAAQREETYALLREHYAEPYRWVGPVLVCTVDGTPIGQAAISTHTTKEGRRVGHHSNGNVLRPWRKQVGWSAREQVKDSPWRPFPIPQEIGVALDLTFTMSKPTGRPKGRQTLPTTSIDYDHLARAIGDALTQAGIYHDDAQIIDARVRKVFAGEHPRALPAPGVVIAVYIITPLTPPADGAHESLSVGVTNPHPER